MSRQQRATVSYLRPAKGGFQDAMTTGDVSADESIGQSDREPVLRSDIRIAAIKTRSSLTGACLKIAGPMLDAVFGVRKLRQFYEDHGLSGLAAQEFASRVVEGLNVDVSVRCDSESLVPQTGPVLLVCNHPYGGLEAMILLRELLKVRSDVKMLGNRALGVLRELDDVLIHVNPLARSQNNLPSLRAAGRQLESEGVLVVFPAGRVSYNRKDKGWVTDHDWNRLVGYLLSKTAATLIPAHVSGNNSRLFLTLGSLAPWLKIAMLPREMIRPAQPQVNVTVGFPVSNKEISDLGGLESTRFARMMTYLQGVTHALPPSKTSETGFQPLADEPDREELHRQVSSLPSSQVLFDYRDFVVCYASQDQAPELVHEIARQRERTFRLHDEGSGQAIDTDSHDARFVHLFVWDTKEHAVLGAYRMGPSDRLSAPDNVYLNDIFKFQDAFYAGHTASLELGRSFVAPEYQKKHYSLHLLWKGIGAYLRRHPQYERLYGTVSLSRQYSSTSIGVMCDALIEPTDTVIPRNPLNIDLGGEWKDYRQWAGEIDLDHLSTIVRSLEHGERDLPVLVRHYHKVGAKFLAVSIDENFNNTPGLLLSVDIHRLPPQKRALYVDSNK